MPAWITSDNIATVAIAVAVLLLAALVTIVPPGSGPRLVHGISYHRAGGRHASGDVRWPVEFRRRPAAEFETALIPVLETAPDAPVSPFAARTA